jgi:hypothetical protein
MLSSVLNQITGILDKRFLLNSFFPSFIFSGLLLVIFFVGQGNLGETVLVWNQQGSILQALEVTGFICWATFLSSVLASQLNTILRFYEGYWSFPLSLFKKCGRARYKRNLEIFEGKLDKNEKTDDSYYEEIYLFYPPRKRPHEIMPTRLGNILKNAEFYPNLRYGIDAVLIWPRLYYLFPEKFIQSIGEARSALDFMLVISFLSGMFALISGVYLYIVKAYWWLFLACFWGGLLVSWLGYRGAIGNAILYAEQIKVAYDLYRNDLLKQMRLELPNNPEEEQKQWDKLDKFFYRNDPTAIQSYTDPTQK